MIIRLIITITLFLSIGYGELLEVPGQYSSIQAAINASVDQDTVMVYPGFYQENISFNGKNITVTSTYIIDQDSLIIGSTIIDGNSNGSVVVLIIMKQMQLYYKVLQYRMEMETMPILMTMELSILMEAEFIVKGLALY